jgi:DNA-binding NarL/FixJ family response regulator
MNNSIKVAILEDLKEVAEILKDQLNEESDIECRHVYYNAEDAMHFLPKTNQVDILIVDIGLPRASGIDAIKHLAEYCPGMQFCMFTVYEDDEKIFNSLASGAHGYLLKSASTEKIIHSIRELKSGGSPMSPSIARRIISSFRNQKSQTKRNDLPLTSRELELLDLLKEGLLYKEIATHMHITVGTVKQHIHKIYKKLHVSNRTEALNKYRGDIL